MDFQNNFEEYLNSQEQSSSENLTHKEMKELQEAINNSKTSAELEEQQREFDRQAVEIQKHFYKPKESTDFLDKEVNEEPSTSKQWIKQPKSLVNTVAVDVIPLQKKHNITFQDFPEGLNKSPLEIVNHTPKFPPPINRDPDYQRFTLIARTKLLCNYYTKIDKLRRRLAAESLYRAPYPRAILPSDRCKASLLKSAACENGGSEDILSQIPVQDLYVSRSGRQIKRKIYTEDEFDNDPDTTYSVKKNKADDDSDLKITLDTPYTPHENLPDGKTSPRNTKTRKDTPRRPVKQILCRSDELFDKLRLNEEKKKQQEEEIEYFEKTLPAGDESDEFKWFQDDSPVKEIQNEDVNFPKRRVAPPIPGRRGKGKKASKEDTEKKDAKPEFPPLSPVLKRYGNGRSTQLKTKAKPRSQKVKETASSEEAVSSGIHKIQCPICNMMFLQSEIENHAANCDFDDAEFDETPGTNTKSVKLITCSLCEHQFEENTDYEVHVKNCIATTIADA